VEHADRHQSAIIDDELMSQQSADSSDAPVLLCFDGSDDAAAAITKAGEFLAPRSAVVLRGGYALHESSAVPAYPAPHGRVRIPTGEATAVWRFGSIGTRVWIER